MNSNLTDYIEEYETEALSKLYGLNGWRTIILTALLKLKKISDEYNVGINIDDIKEKYGTLRIYVSLDFVHKCDTKPVWEVIDQIVDEAETASESTCERCGKPGKLREGNWLQTLCDDCYTNKS